MAAPYAVVVGGVNVDIGGISCAPLRRADSNPGRVRTSLGGVGRNIAHNLSLMGVKVSLIAALGGDLYARRIRASCEELGIDLSHALVLPDCATSTYLYVADHKGEMDVAISDMAICDRLTPDALADRAELLRGASAVVVDTNIPAESIRWLCDRVTCPVFADPVSVSKAEKLRPVLGRIHTLKPNRLEAELLSGSSIPAGGDPAPAAAALLRSGVRRVFLSLGSGGVYAADAGGGHYLSNPPCTPVNSTGCGDAFTAALVWAHIRDLSLTDSARAGLAAASIAMESPDTINPAMREELLLRRMASIC